MRRIITITMAAAIGMILVALVTAGILLKHDNDVQRDRFAASQLDRDMLRQELRESKDATNALLSLIETGDKTRAAALSAAVKQVSDELAQRINALFAQERSISKAEADRQLAAIRAAQADLEKRIAAILAGPPGPSGPAGPAGSPGKCQLVCL